VAPGGSVLYRRALVATRRGLSDVARMAALLAKQPIGHITGVLASVPAWGLLTAVASDGTIAMKDNVRDDGSFDLAVPPGRFTVVLQTPGGWDETVVNVEQGPRPTEVSLVAPQAERLDFRITDPDGHPIPGRLVLTGVDGTPDPRFTSVPRVSAAGNEVHSVSGEGRVDVPPGRYRVVASRGVEWSIAEKIIDVKPEQGVALRAVLTHEMPTPGWISADLHLHARPSRDSELPLTDRVTSLVTAGVEFAVATDHNHVTDYEPAMKEVEATSLLSATRGVEVTTRTWGHFNAYPLPAGSPAPPYSVDPPEIFAAIRHRAHDAVIQVNHPWNPGYGYFHRAVLNERTGTHWRKQFSFDFDLIEVVNGYELGSSDVPWKNLHRYFDLLNLGRRYTAVGSSDSHKLTNEWAGYPRTYVRVADDRPNAASAEEIAASLRAGHAIVSLGPFVEAHVGEAGPGDTVRVAPGTVPLDVTVRAADWVDATRLDLVVGGDIVDSYELPPPASRDSFRWARTIDVPVSWNTFISVVVQGDRAVDQVMPGRSVKPFAFTNPIWIDVGAPREDRSSARPSAPRRARGKLSSAPPEQADEPLTPDADRNSADASVVSPFAPAPLDAAAPHD
ncbi:MAG TPA: CehA/McbA family metallohydrolase, partial [Polyangiaceae bacterium]|nr:CehA/McbA family metallohydrolase [Polyangiaceae bacterium]